MPNNKFARISSDNDYLINIFSEQKECSFRSELYSVRDNGAVLRHKPTGKSHSRPLDERWTFGRKDSKTGYMTISSHRVHIIVATAFHGANDTSKLVVDHIDTNRCNNRPENLRWVTRLENALNNPVTRKKIIYRCGSIENFLNDPSCICNKTDNNQDVSWMRTVSSEEAKNAYKRVMSWSSTTSVRSYDRTVGEWIFTAPSTNVYRNGEEITSGSNIERTVPTYFDSLSKKAKQKNWKTPTEFPLCPVDDDEQTLESYLAKLGTNKIISINQYSTHFADEFGIHEDKLFIKAHTDKDAIKPYSLITVSVENGMFIHECSTFFKKDGAAKAFALGTGGVWTHGDVFDDYC